MMTQHRKIKAQIRELARLNNLRYTEAKRQFEQIMTIDDPMDYYIPHIKYEEYDSQRTTDAILLGYTVPEIKSVPKHIRIIPKNKEQSLVFWDMDQSESSVLYTYGRSGSGAMAQMQNIIDHSAHHAAMRYTIDVGNEKNDSLTTAGFPSSGFLILQKVYQHIVENQESKVPIYLFIYNYDAFEDAMQESLLLSRTFQEIFSTILTEGKDHGIYTFLHTTIPVKENALLSNIHHTYDLIEMPGGDRAPGEAIIDDILFKVFPTS